MVFSDRHLGTADPVWSRIVDEASAAIRREPLLDGLFRSAVLDHETIEGALSHRIARMIAAPDVPEERIREIAQGVFASDPGLALAARADLIATLDRDPACNTLLQAMVFFKGFQALIAYRLFHALWTDGRRDLASLMQSRVSELYTVDIHPAARIGRGIMIDHGHSIVVGETAVVGDNVSILHAVTLGGTGRGETDRHPKIGDGVLIGAGAKVLGNISIGQCTRIAAGSVVLADVPPMKTVAGVPARIVGEAGCNQPSEMMDQLFRPGR